MKTLNNMLSEQLKDEEFRKEYEAIQPEMDVIRAIEAADLTEKRSYRNVHILELNNLYR